MTEQENQTEQIEEVEEVPQINKQDSLMEGLFPGGVGNFKLEF
jgi:hypothetical protein